MSKNTDFLLKLLIHLIVIGSFVKSVLALQSVWSLTKLNLIIFFVIGSTIDAIIFSCLFLIFFSTSLELLILYGQVYIKIHKLIVLINKFYIVLILLFILWLNKY